MRKWAVAAAVMALGATPAGAEPLAWPTAIEAIAGQVGQPAGVTLRSLMVQDIREQELQARWPLSDMLATSLAEAIARRQPGFKVLNTDRATTLGAGVDGVLTGTFTRSPGGYRLALQVQRLATHETLYSLPAFEIAETSLPSGALPKTGFGRLVLTVNFPDAKVFVDGEPVGTGGRALPLSLGTHVVTVAREGWDVYERSVLVQPGEPTLLDVQLRRKEIGARIEANVPEALVAIDGKAQGLTPISLASLEPGKHRLSVTKAGFRTYEAEIDWQGKEQVIKAELALVPGSLVVSADVPEALIAVDGQSRGKAPLFLGDLGPGLHRLTAQAPGCAPFEQEVKVLGSETVNVRVRLLPDLQAKDDDSTFEAIALLPQSPSHEDRQLVQSVYRRLSAAGTTPVLPPDEAARTLERLMPEGWRDDVPTLKKLARALKARRVVLLGVESFTPFSRLMGVWPQRPSLGVAVTTYRSAGYREGDTRHYTLSGGEPWGFGTDAPGREALTAALLPAVTRELAEVPETAAAPGEPLIHEAYALFGTNRLDAGLGYETRIWPMVDLGVGYRYFNALGADRLNGTRLSASGPGSDLVYGMGQAHQLNLEALWRFDPLLPRRGPAFEGSRWIPYVGAGYRLNLARYEVYGVGRTETEGGFWQPQNRGVALAGLKVNLGGVLYRGEVEVPVVYQVGDSNAARWTLGAGWLF